MLGFAFKRSLQAQFKSQTQILQNISSSDMQLLKVSSLHSGCSFQFSETKDQKPEEKKTEQKTENSTQKDEKQADQEQPPKGNLFEETTTFFRTFNAFDKLGEAKDQWEMFRIRRQKKLVEKRMAREIKDREKFEKMSEEEREKMETAISKEFIDNLDIIDEADKFFHMYYTQSCWSDRVKVKLQYLKCRLFYAKELADKQEAYDKIFLKLRYNPNGLNQSLPIAHYEVQKWFERYTPDYYTKTRWELFKSMKPQLEREYGIKFDANGQSISAQQQESEPNPESATSSADPEEAVEEPTEEQIQAKLAEQNLFQTSLSIITDDQVFKPTVKNLQASQEQEALDKMKLLNMVGWNRTQTIKLFHQRDRTEYNNMTYRHEYFCVREEMNNYLKNKSDIDLSTMTEKERLTMFSTATFDPKENFRRKWRLFWLNHRNKIGYGFNEGETKTGVWFDLGVFENLGKSRGEIKEASSSLKESYDDQVQNSQTSVYGGAAFLLSHSSKDNSMEKCLEFIRQYDKEFSQQDLEDFLRDTFQKAYTYHLKGMLYEIEQICQEQALGYFRAVWNVWRASKAKPKYQRVWGVERPAFSSSEINSQNQPVFSFTIHCQTNHCLVDEKDGVTLKEGTDERVMRNGYQVIIMFDPQEENIEEAWKIISISPIEKTLLLA